MIRYQPKDPQPWITETFCDYINRGGRVNRYVRSVRRYSVADMDSLLKGDDQPIHWRRNESGMILPVHYDDGTPRVTDS